MKIGDVFSDEDFDRSRSGASLIAGQGVAPDQQAEAVKLGNRYGLHPDTARASLDELRQRADMEDRRKALDAAPGLRAWVAEKPQNAPLADLRDMEVMGTLERKLRSFAEGLGGQFVGSGVTGIGQSLDAMQRRVIEGVASLVLPKPRAGGAVDPASLHGPLMGEGWRQLGQPVKDYWREAGVPAAQKDFADDVVSGLGQMLGQMGLTALNPPAGVAMMFGQGADTMADKTAKDTGTQKNRDLAILGSGAWTGATEWASNKFILGMEKLPGIKMLDLKTPAFSRAARIGLAAAEEDGQEFAENVGQDWMRQTLTNPNAPIDFGDAGYQAGVGGTVGAIVRSMVEGALHIRGRQNRQVFEALREADPELRKRLPEAYRDFVAKQTEGGGIENVFVPAERFVEYFQGVGLDPRVVASAIGAKNFQEAVAAGSDIVIPTADFAVHVATGEHFDGLAPDLKLHQGDLTQRELDALNASKAERESRLQAEFARMIEEGKQAQNINTAIESIVSDVEGQLVAAHMDPKAARDTAQVMRGAAVLASRAYPHLSPVEAAEKMWERYGLTVGRPMPDVLTKLKQADMSLDPLLNMIRAAQGPTETQINGPSLVEFLRNAGGLLPVGELLDAQQARTPPGKKSLIQDSGLSLDEAAMKAVEAGFFDGIENGQLTETQLVEAITREVLGGSPEFSAAMQDQKAMETARTLAELAEVLDQAGVDLKAMDNQTARERLMQFSQGQVLEQPHGNPAEHQTPLHEGATEIDVDGVKRPALNSEGRPIHWSEEGVRNFWRWFGDSKVVDAEGRPLVVYHGTPSDFSVFDKAKLASNTGANSAAKGFFMSADATTASSPFYTGFPFDLYQDAYLRRRVLAAAERLGYASSVEIKPFGLWIADWKKRAEVNAVATEIAIEEMEKPGRLREEARKLDPPSWFFGKKEEVSTENKARADALRKEADALDDALKYEAEARAVALNKYRMDEDGNSRFDSSMVAPNVMPLYVAIRNPFVHDYEGDSYRDKTYADVIDTAQEGGHDGVILVGTTDGGPVTNIYIAFRPEQIKSAIGNRGTFSAGDANILYQGPRGSLRIGNDRRMAITLTENANLSTFLHETGHFYLEMMGDLAEDPAADQQVKDDYAALLGWLGVKSRAEIAVEHHEKFARANEAYLMEGNAPAPELRGVFQRFKAWLVGVYRDIANLDVKLNDDVRAVFDRIYATDQEIEAAKREVDVSSLFLDAAAAGMTEAEFAAYAGQIERVSEEAQGTLMRRLMAEYQRGKEAWWKDERARTLKEVTAEVDAQPVYRAFAALVAGKMEDGTPVKLDRDDIGRRYGEGTLKQLPRGFQRIYASEGGLDIDTAAEMFGFPSGEAMLKSFLEMRPRKELIQAETDARMRERHGDLMTDGRIEEAARDALHNERRADVLATELRALNRKIREATPAVRFERQKAQQAQRENVAALDALPSPAMFRRAAAGMIDAMAVRDIRPHAYLLAGRKAAREAAAALARDQAGDAFSAKQRELLNHYLYLEAVKARNEADALRDYAKTFEGSRKREKLGKAGHDYLDQAEALLDRFEFSRISLTALQRRKSLREFIAEKEADGEIILIPEHLQDEARRINWREMSMGELRGLGDALRNLDHLAGFKNKLLVKRKAMEFAAVKAELLASLESAFQASTGDLDTFKENRTVGQTMNRFGRSLDGSLLKVEQLVEWMDGGRIDGPWARFFFDQADDAQAREYDLHKAVTTRLMALADQMGSQWRSSMMDKTDVVLPGIVGPLSRYRLISIALNTGNATNFQRLTQGMGWSEDQVRNALERLTAQDWTYVQGVWDTLETLWPDIAALQERVAGVPPPKVEAREVVTPHGTFRGGYFPLVYDPAKSNAGEKQANAAESVAQFMSQGYGRANTDRGATKARIENFAAPLMIDFEAVLTDHLPKVIKDISHREAALSLNKLLHDKEIKAALIDRIGMDRYQLLTGWEQTLIQDRADAFHRQFAAAHWSLSRLRANTSVVTMGWKVSTMFAQIAGFGPSWDLVGGKALTKGLMEFTAHPLKSLEMVAEKSGEMRHRMDTLDRDIKEALLATRGETGIVHAVRRTAFYLTGIADRMVSMPTWLGAYRKTLAEGGSEETAIRAGDRAVRLSQGAGGAKDLAAVQRNTEIMKLVTMYYTPFSALYARMRDAGHSTRGVRDLPRLVARSIGLVILPAVLGELLAGRPPDDDEDPVAWAARKSLLYPAASIPIFRDLVQWQLDPLLASLSGGNLQHQPGYKFTPIISAVEKLARMPGHAFDAMTGDRPWDDTAWEMLEGSGYLFGLPTAQPRITGEYLEDLFTGDASPETAAEMWHDLLFRRPPERAKR